MKRETSNIKGKKINQLTPKVLSKDENGLCWKCYCECGNAVYLTKSDLLSGRYKNCQDPINHPEPKPKAKEKKEIMGSLWTQYIGGAKDRDLPWEVSGKEFLEITSKSCHYCGGEPNRKSRLVISGETFEYEANGIDRAD